MLLDLTDHLRCPEEHAEHYLVVLPDRMSGRDVCSGDVACPICGRTVRIENGILRFDDVPVSEEQTALTADGAVALLAIDGPGGVVGLIGSVGLLAPDLLEVLPGVHLVAVNPPRDVSVPGRCSVVYANRSPLKANSLRGVVVGTDGVLDAEIARAAAGALLAGRCAVMEGPVRTDIGLTVVASSPQVWVGRRSSA